MLNNKEEFFLTTGEIGDRIKELRKEKGMTQKELANAMGVTASMIGQYETGIRIPKYETLERVAKALSISVETLMGKGIEVDLGLLAIDLIRKYGLSVETAEKIVSDCVDTLDLSFKSGDWAKFSSLFCQLNAAGKETAYERVRELTEIPRYRKQPSQEE